MVDNCIVFLGCMYYKVILYRVYFIICSLFIFHIRIYIFEKCLLMNLIVNLMEEFKIPIRIEFHCCQTRIRIWTMWHSWTVENRAKTIRGPTLCQLGLGGDPLENDESDKFSMLIINPNWPNIEVYAFTYPMDILRPILHLEMRLMDANNATIHKVT